MSDPVRLDTSVDLGPSRAGTQSDWTGASLHGRTAEITGQKKEQA
jgi:hypothetical protein